MQPAEPLALGGGLGGGNKLAKDVLHVPAKTLAPSPLQQPYLAASLVHLTWSTQDEELESRATLSPHEEGGI